MGLIRMTLYNILFRPHSLFTNRCWARGFMKNKITITTLLFLLLTNNIFPLVKINIWHAYRGAEKKAIERVTHSFNVSHNNIQVELLAVPFGALRDKLMAMLPMAKGPDIFIGGSSAVGFYSERGYILPLEVYFSKSDFDEFFPYTVKAFNYMYPEAVWGVPASTKNLALFYNKSLVKNPPQKMSRLLELAKKFTRPKQGQFGRWGFAYEVGNFYYHSAWLHGFGGKLFRYLGMDSEGTGMYLPLVYTTAMINSGRYVKKNIIDNGVCPDAPSGTLITQLFNTGNTMFVLNGQWFRGEIDSRINYGVADFPVIEETGMRAKPLLTVEGYYLTTSAKDQASAIKVIKYFSSAAMQKVFATVGKHTPANKKAFNYSAVRNDNINKIFVKIARNAVSIHNGPEMALGWGPFTGALGDMLGGVDDKALRKQQQELMKAIEDFRGKSGMFKKAGYNVGRMNKPIE